MKIAWKIEVPQWLVLAAMFIGAAVSWSHAPDRIPVHWNLSGQADRYGGRVEGLLLMPLVASGIYLLMLVLPRIDPGRANYARFRGAYSAIRITVLAIFAVFYGMTQAWIWTGHVSLTLAAPLTMGIVLVILGSLLGKIRPNWFVGIRTPWTLSSKVSWVRTHRAGGWLFILVGLVTIVASFVSSRTAIWVLLGGLIGGTIGLVMLLLSAVASGPGQDSPCRHTTCGLDASTRHLSRCPRVSVGRAGSRACSAWPSHPILPACPRVHPSRC